MNDLNLALDLTKTTSRVDVLEDRFERHLEDMKKQTETLSLKVDALISAMNLIHLDLINKIGDTNLRIYTVNGLISAFVSGMITLLLRKS